jgi:hypothetical protein
VLCDDLRKECQRCWSSRHFVFQFRLHRARKWPTRMKDTASASPGE